eukprot:3845267-Rhodomonas_salina.6
MERVPARVNQQGKENMNGHREDRKLEAELRRRESEVSGQPGRRAVGEEARGVIERLGDLIEWLNDWLSD